MKYKDIFNSIAFRISFAIAIVIAATTITVGEMILREEKKTLELELQNKGKYLAELISNSLVDHLLYEEFHTIYSLLDGTVKSGKSIVVHAAVYDKKGALVAAVYKNEYYKKTISQLNLEDPLNRIEIMEDTKLPIYHLSVPIKAKTSDAIGFLKLCLTKEPLYKILNDVRQKFYLLGAGIIFAGVMLALWLTRRLLRPIITLNDGVRMVAGGELGVELPVVGTGEIKELSQSFNVMSVKLKELVNTIESAQDLLIRTEKLYAIGEFSAGIAHEIKNPLTSIKMLMQIVMKKKEALTSKDIAVIEEEINRIDKIISEFLTFTKPERSEKEVVNVNNVLEDVITVTKPVMDRAEIFFEDSFSPTLPVINGNHDDLKQVFLNLVLNAVHAMDGAGGTLKISTSVENDNLYVIITDTGVGIPLKDVNKIFDPFFTTKKKGTGMGLTLTHNIVSNYSGKIFVDSTTGVGTSVTVELPL